MFNLFLIRKVAVFGSGELLAQISAQFANARIPVICYESSVDLARGNLANLISPYLVSEQVSSYVTLIDQAQDLSYLATCDLVIEAIADDFLLKIELYKQIVAAIKPHTIIASNSAGVSLTKLVTSVPQRLSANFCGVHFFNPLSKINLVELVATPYTSNEILDNLEGFLVRSLGKNVIRALDTPNFIANRLGLFWMLVCLHYAQKFAISLEVVDQLTGKNLGHAKTATFRLADLVGLEHLAYAMDVLQRNCHDSFAELYHFPSAILELLNNRHVIPHVVHGLYSKDEDGIKILDLISGKYQIANHVAAPEVLQILHLNSWDDKLVALSQNTHPQSQFLWSALRDLFHYCAILLGEISNTPQAMDLALCYGLAWHDGVFEIWQQAGWLKIAKLIDKDIQAGKSLTQQRLPAWVFDLQDGIYVKEKYFAVHTKSFVELERLAIYQCQLKPIHSLMMASKLSVITLYENAGVKLWHSGDDIGILSLKSKNAIIGMDVLLGMGEAINYAEKNCKALVIYQAGENFSEGANLAEFNALIEQDGINAVYAMLDLGHEVIATKIRYSCIPIIAAVRGYALGGGCEIVLHCDAVVAAMESYIGLVETGVGLIPGWGGVTEMALRATHNLNSWETLVRSYQNIALAKTSISALHAQELGYLRESDTIVMHSDEILYIAKQKAQFMYLTGYRQAIPKQIKVFNLSDVVKLQQELSNSRTWSNDAQIINEYLAMVICGVSDDKAKLKSEQELFSLERDVFAKLILSQATQAKIKKLLNIK